MPKTAPLFPMIRAALGPDLREHGFAPMAPPRELKSLFLPWTRTEADGRTLELSFQRHHKPWLVDWLGTAFTVNLKLPATDKVDTRIWFLMELDERARMRAIHDRIVQRLPDFHEATDLMPGEIMVLEMEWESLHRPWIPNYEVWFRYRTPDDLSEWLPFLGELLPVMIERFLRQSQT